MGNEREEADKLERSLLAMHDLLTDEGKAIRELAYESLGFERQRSVEEPNEQ